MLGRPACYDNYAFGFLAERFWQRLPQRSKKGNMQKLIYFHTKEKASMIHVSGSGCYEKIFGGYLLSLLASKSKSCMPDVFMIF